MAKKIPSKKFSTAKKKLPSRKFSKSQTKIPSKKFAKGTAKIASRPFPSTAASKKQEASELPNRPANEAERQDRIKTLKKKLKSLGDSK